MPAQRTRSNLERQSCLIDNSNIERDCRGEIGKMQQTQVSCQLRLLLKLYRYFPEQKEHTYRLSSCLHDGITAEEPVKEMPPRSRPQIPLATNIKSKQAVELKSSASHGCGCCGTMDGCSAHYSSFVIPPAAFHFRSCQETLAECLVVLGS